MEPWWWRWSATFEVGSALAIAVAIVVLVRAQRRPELHAWSVAWLANLAAVVLSALVLPMPSKPALVVAAYLFAKTQFLVLLVAGANVLAQERPRPVPHGAFSAVIGLFSILCALAIATLDRVGMVQSVITGATLLAGAIAVIRSKPPGWRWLASGFVIRMMLAAAETDGYAMLSWGRGVPEWLAGFLDVHALFDTGAEWIIALGCVIALRGRREPYPH